MSRKIEQKHISTALKIISAKKYEEVERHKSSPITQKKKMHEMEYVEKVIQALWSDIESFHKQTKLL